MNNLIAEEIKNRWLAVQERIELSAIRAQRKPDDIKVIVVTKFQPIERIEAATQCGIHDFGENYPELAVEKIEYFHNISDIRWHMIGHLQSRKAPLVAKEFSMFHALDSIRTAQKLDNALSVYNKILPVLLEVNVSSEESKYGWKVDEKSCSQWMEQVEIISQLPHIRINGLMTMPPFFDDPELSRPYFSKLHDLLIELHKQFPALHLDHLSMGTSQDFGVAIEEGATMVRIGTAIMGSRNISQ
jgi:pyridoxal phosphate enzyme (YggS family)